MSFNHPSSGNPNAFQIGACDSSAAGPHPRSADFGTVTSVYVDSGNTQWRPGSVSLLESSFSSRTNPSLKKGR